MRYVFLLPLLFAAMVAAGMAAGGASPIAPYAVAALLGSAFALEEVGRRGL